MKLKTNMDFNEILARLAKTPKAAVDKAMQERKAKTDKTKLNKAPKTPRA